MSSIHSEAYIVIHSSSSSFRNPPQGSIQHVLQITRTLSCGGMSGRERVIEAAFNGAMQLSVATFYRTLNSTDNHPHTIIIAPRGNTIFSGIKAPQWIMPYAFIAIHKVWNYSPLALFLALDKSNNNNHPPEEWIAN